MSKVILGLFLVMLSSCAEPEPEFLFGDNIKVVRGFYKGAIGNVYSLLEMRVDLLGGKHRIYRVHVTLKGDEFELDSKEEDLKRVD